jgi:hypothetical protein
MARDPDRDRDERGRARNARPQDRLGRPLPRGKAGVVPWPDESELTPHESLTTAQELLERGWPFQAHEVLEAAWKTAPGPQLRPAPKRTDEPQPASADHEANPAGCLPRLMLRPLRA